MAAAAGLGGDCLCGRAAHAHAGAHGPLLAGTVGDDAPLPLT